jgi:glycosyltransferase involved in cell wall biosynthesis
VITPSFRQLDWLKLCAASVADQEGVRWEHLVQDAGTGPEVAAWAEGRPGLRLFVEKDQGMYDAVNRGLRRARAPVCCYLNCDEQYLPGALRAVLDFFAARPEVDVLCGDFLVVDAAMRARAYRRVVPPLRWHTRLSHLGVATCATFFRRRVVERGILFRPDLKVVGDADWVCRLLRAGCRFAVLPRPLALFTLTGTNLSGQEIAAREQADLAPPLGGLLPAARLAARVSHAARKLLAGAYARRTIDYAAYSPESPSRRVAFRGARVGAGWPRE